MVEKNKHVIYVPYWIVGALQRNNLPLSTILDYRKMAQMVSPQEQANMLLFEGFNPFVEKKSGNAGLNQPDYSIIVVAADTSITESDCAPHLYNVWQKSVAGSSDANDNALFKNLETINALSWSNNTKGEVAMRFNPENAGRLPHNEPFITYDVEREYVFVVVYPAFFDSRQYSANTQKLCEAVLKVLYVYNTPESGCKTPYFRKYLESLV